MVSFMAFPNAYLLPVLSESESTPSSLTGPHITARQQQSTTTLSSTTDNDNAAATTSLLQFGVRQLSTTCFTRRRGLFNQTFEICIRPTYQLTSPSYLPFNTNFKFVTTVDDLF